MLFFLQAFLDWKSIRNNVEEVKINVKNRNSDADPDKVVRLYDEFREAQNEAERLRSDRNANAKAMKVLPLLVLKDPTKPALDLKECNEFGFQNSGTKLNPNPVYFYSRTCFGQMFKTSSCQYCMN